MCLKEIHGIINDFIKEKEIRKSDIIGYQAEKWVEHAGIHFVHCKVTLSWFDRFTNQI